MLDKKSKKIISILKEKGATKELAVVILLYIKEQNKDDIFKDKVIKYIEEKDCIREGDIIRYLSSF